MPELALLLEEDLNEKLQTGELTGEEAAGIRSMQAQSLARVKGSVEGK